MEAAEAGAHLAINLTQRKSIRVLDACSQNALNLP